MIIDEFLTFFYLIDDIFMYKKFVNNIKEDEEEKKSYLVANSV